MTRSITLALLALMPLAASAQSAATCPTLPVDAGLHWEQLDGPGFLFCKAIAGDGAEAFAVTISRESPFKPRRVDRAEDASIGGQSTHWYRSQLASEPSVIVRETLVELREDQVAHVSLRAASEQAKERAMQQVQALRFEDVRLSSN